MKTNPVPILESHHATSYEKFIFGGRATSQPLAPTKPSGSAPTSPRISARFTPIWLWLDRLADVGPEQFGDRGVRAL